MAEFALAMPVGPNAQPKVANFEIGVERQNWLRQYAAEQTNKRGELIRQRDVVCEAIDQYRRRVERRGPDGRWT